MFPEQRPKAAPDIVEHHRLRGGGRMQAVALEGLAVIGETFEQEGLQRDLDRKSVV